MITAGAQIALVVLLAIYRRNGFKEQISAERKLFSTMAVRQQAVVTDAMKAARQNVQKETAHELAGLDAHDLILLPIASLMAPPTEADVGIVKIEQAVVRDRHTMGVLRKVGQELLTTGESLLGIDEPFCPPQRREHCRKRHLPISGAQARQRIAGHQP